MGHKVPFVVPRTHIMVTKIYSFLIALRSVYKASEAVFTS